MKKNIRGEIATVLAVGALVILGAASLVNSLFINKRQTVKTKAQGLYTCYKGGQPVEQCQSFDKCDVDGRCNPACCKVDSQCPNGQKCDIPNGYCVSGKSCNPQTSKKLTCVSGQCVWQPCSGNDCNVNTCTSHAQCQNQVNPTPTPVSGGGGQTQAGCFYLTADLEVRNEGAKKAFYAWVTFYSQRGGDIKLEYNGIHVAGWNRFSGGSFTYSPQWTQPFTHDYESGIAALNPGQTMPFTYRGMHSGCSPQDFTLSCSIKVDGAGNPSVSGSGCRCRNCGQQQSPQVPTPTPLPTRMPPGAYSTPTPTQSLRCECIDGRWNNFCDSLWVGRPCGSTPTPTPTPLPTRMPPGAYSNPTPTSTPISTPTPTPTPIPTLTPIPTPTPTPVCNVADTRYCIDWGVDEEKRNGQSSFPWCQLPDERWVYLVDTRIYDEGCHYIAAQSNEIEALEGVRKVERKNGGQKENYSCLYNINGKDCNSGGSWDQSCDKLCDLLPSYNITIKIDKKYFIDFFPLDSYESPTGVIFSGNILEKDFKFDLDVSSNNNSVSLGQLKRDGYEFKLPFETSKLTQYFDSSNLLLLQQFKSEITRTKSGATQNFSTIILNNLVLDPENLSLVILCNE